MVLPLLAGQVDAILGRLTIQCIHFGQEAFTFPLGNVFFSTAAFNKYEMPAARDDVCMMAQKEC